MMKTLLVTATLAVLAAPALAQTPTTQPAMKDDHFAMADANKDGALSLAEVQKADAKVTQADFDKYDADKSKSLSKPEFQKWAEAKMTPPASAPGQ
jgi:hypothetical protein